MRRSMWVLAAFAGIAAWPAAAHAHPGLHAQAGALTYLISSVVTAVMVAGCVFASRRTGKR